MKAIVCAIRSLSCGYSDQRGHARVIEGVDLALKSGEMIGILGESGVGKSTLLSVIAGEHQADEGSVELDGSIGSRLAFFRQFDTLLPFRNLIENTQLLGERRSRTNDGVAGNPMGLLAAMGLSDRAYAYPDELSGGMRQRVQLAQSLAYSPKLLLLDEPFSQQDLITQIKLEELVASVVRTSDGGALIVSHDLGALAALCGKVIALGGRPASIHSSLSIEGELGALSPSMRRNSKEYPALMAKLWDMRLAASQC